MTILIVRQYLLSKANFWLFFNPALTGLIIIESSAELGRPLRALDHMTSYDPQHGFGHTTEEETIRLSGILPGKIKKILNS